ncbi:MAG TPA: helix-turn-helix transcriptional regulator [Anaeromyxobacteraceae bacterium]|nr:helix-turn-helix transcriptional regulator [Anaeromyxobacteraceae bacterium]
MPDQLLKTEEVAKVLRVHPKHVYRLLKKGLPARRVGSEWRFSRDEVLAWSGAKPARGEADEVGATAPFGDGLPPALVAANGDVAVLLLLRFAARLGPPLLGFVQADTGSAADLLRRGAVLAAGAHAGGFPTHVGDERVARLHLVRREIGLVYPKGPRPFRVRDLARKRLASRPTSAGVRSHLDEALRAERLDPARVHKKALVLDSHLDVILAVVAGRADVGVASRAWGERAGLGFLPLASEAYGLIVKARDLGDRRVVRLCEVAQAKQFRDEVGTIPGYDTSGSGDIRYDV